MNATSLAAISCVLVFSSCIPISGETTPQGTQKQTSTSQQSQASKTAVSNQQIQGGMVPAVINRQSQAGETVPTRSQEAQWGGTTLASHQESQESKAPPTSNEQTQGGRVPAASNQHYQVNVADQFSVEDRVAVKLTPGQKKAVEGAKTLPRNSAAVYGPDGTLVKRGPSEELTKTFTACKDVRKISDNCWVCEKDSMILCANSKDQKPSPSEEHVKPASK